MFRVAASALLSVFAVSCLSHSHSVESHAMSESTLPDFNQLWDFNNPLLSEEKFTALFKEQESTAPKNYLLELQTQIARAQGLQKKFNEAHQTLALVEQQLNDQPHRLKIRYLLEKGRLLNSSGEKPESIPFFLQAYELGQRSKHDDLNDDITIDAAHMLGIVVSSSEEQIDWNEKALATAERSSNREAQRWRGSLYNNLGWTYFDLKNYPKALELFQKAVIHRQEMGQERELQIAKWCVARVLRAQGHIQEALREQLSLLSQLPEESAQTADAGYIYEELAECYLSLGQTAKAKDFFSDAYHILSQDPWLKESEPARLERMKKLAGL